MPAATTRASTTLGSAVALAKAAAGADAKAALEKVEPVLDTNELLALQKAARAVDVVRPLKEYIVELTTATRTHPDVVVGVSPRGGASLQRLAQALALFENRRYVIPDDIKRAAPAVMAHRLLTRDRRSDTALAVVTQTLAATRIPVD